MKRTQSILWMVVAIVLASFCLSSCSDESSDGYDGYDAEKAAQLCEKFENDKDSFTERDAAAMLQQWVAAYGETDHYFEKRRQGETTTEQYEEFMKIYESRDDMERILFSSYFEKEFPEVYEDYREECRKIYNKNNNF